MGMNDTPTANRLHIGIFGKRNAGKSSLINAITEQNLAIVSDVAGTTTDPVYKAMELLPVGPVVLVDTPGLDDEGELGQQRIQKTKQVLRRVDMALLVVGPYNELVVEEQNWLQDIQKLDVPYLLVHNKIDADDKNIAGEDGIWVSAQSGYNISLLKEKIAEQLAKAEKPKFPIVADLIQQGDTVVLVTPIDSAAPKGRLILPQQQTIREILDSYALAVVTQVAQLPQVLSQLKEPPRMVITDSQAFEEVAAIVPQEVPLTSFSILFARHKGILPYAVDGAKVVDDLQENDKVLICEGCTHHKQCDDIGTVKLPNWLKKHTGKDLAFSFVNGTDFPEDVTPFKLVVHCGGCMLQEREVRARMYQASRQHVPVTNYGILIAYLKGILDRSIELLAQ